MVCLLCFYSYLSTVLIFIVVSCVCICLLCLYLYLLLGFIFVFVSCVYICICFWGFSLIRSPHIWPTCLQGKERLTTLHSSTLLYFPLHCNTLLCVASHCNTLLCIALNYILFGCIVLLCFTLHYISLHCIAIHYFSLHCNTLLCTLVDNTSLLYIRLHCIGCTLLVALHWNPLDYIGIHWIIRVCCSALHSSALHCQPEKR